MAKIFGSKGSGRRRGLQLAAIFSATMLLALIAALPAQAVHDVGVFQLDKNASTAAQSTPPALEDWDLICKAHPSTCTFASGYPMPSGTTVADPSQFVVDPSESATDDILKGGTKDDNDINSWKWASAKPSPPKNDITHAFAAEYTCASTASPLPGNNVSACDTTAIANPGDKLLYFGGDRFSNSGSANLAFWFFQHKISQKLADGTTDAKPGDACTISAGCIFGGTHTAGTVPHSDAQPGDILIISAFGPKAKIQVYEWVGVGKAPAPCFTNACSLVPLIPASAGQACEDVSNDVACGTVNDLVTQSPWTLSQKNAPANSFQPTNFFEGGINLSSLGLENACFSSFLMNTRASAAGDAELHDKVLGQFGRCAPSLTTHASTNGTVQPGTAVTDTATVTVTGATSPTDPTGTVNFFLCGPDTSANPTCTSDGTAIGSGTLVGGTPNDGIATAVSPEVNTGAGLANGHYCFRAEWPGDPTYGTFSPPITNPDNTEECFQVLQHPTQTVTDPQQPPGTTITGDVALGSSVVDHAVVTDLDAGGGPPTGSVNFFVCNPTQTSGGSGSEFCDSGFGDPVTGNPVALTLGSPTADQSEATSGAVTANLLGVWCFRATYVPSGTVFTGSSGDGHQECFRVTTTSSAISRQNWLPNDHVEISTATGATLTGTLDIDLRSGSCNGSVVYQEPAPYDGSDITVTVPITGGVDTTNGTFKVDADNAGTYYWRIVFTPNSPFATGFTKCETSTVTINNNP